jgi:hypothetical protein
MAIPVDGFGEDESAFGAGVKDMRKRPLPASHVFDNVPSDDQPVYLRGSVKASNESPLCLACVTKALIRKCLYTIAGGPGNAMWQDKFGFFAHPLGSSLWETIQLCRLPTQNGLLYWQESPSTRLAPLEPTPEEVKEKKEPPPSGLVTRADDLGYIYTFHPARYRFLWREARACFLCGGENLPVANEVEKVAVEPAVVTALREKFTDPMYLGSGVSTLRNLGKVLRESESPLLKKGSRFRYCGLSIFNTSVIGEEFGGIFDLPADEETKEEEPKNVKPFPKGSTLMFLERLRELSLWEAETLRQGFFSREAHAILEKVLWKRDHRKERRRTPLRMLLLRLYPHYPVAGHHVPLWVNVKSLDGAEDVAYLLRLVEMARERNCPINWYGFAKKIWASIYGEEPAEVEVE